MVKYALNQNSFLNYSYLNFAHPSLPAYPKTPAPPTIQELPEGETGTHYKTQCRTGCQCDRERGEHLVLARKGRGRRLGLEGVVRFYLGKVFWSCDGSAMQIGLFCSVNGLGIP